MTHKSWLRKVLNWTDSTPTVQIEAEEDNIAYDRSKVDEVFMEALRAAKHLRRASDAFIVAGELFVKDVSGNKTHAKISARTKKPK